MKIIIRSKTETGIKAILKNTKPNWKDRFAMKTLGITKSFKRLEDGNTICTLNFPQMNYTQKSLDKQKKQTISDMKQFGAELDIDYEVKVE